MRSFRTAVEWQAIENFQRKLRKRTWKSDAISQKETGKGGGGCGAKLLTKKKKRLSLKAKGGSDLIGGGGRGGP